MENQVMEVNVLGCMDNSKDCTFDACNRVYDTDGLSPTLQTCTGGGHQPKVVHIARLVGRDKDNPKFRGKATENFEQILEPREDELCGSLTTIQKDNLLMEMSKAIELNPMEDGTCRTIKNQYHMTGPSNMQRQGTFGATGVVHIRQATKQGSVPCELPGIADLNYVSSKTRRGRVQENGQVCPTLATENMPNVLEDWMWEVDGETYLIRIRKLTPRECWRLMGFSDADFEKAEQVNSNTQLYKQAGNSIVKNVLMEVFRNLL